MNDIVSLVPTEAIELSSCADGSLQSIRLHERIATKTFDSIHRSMVFNAEYRRCPVVVKIWETSDTQNGFEMAQMFQNERDALRELSNTGFAPRIILEADLEARGLQLKTAVLVLEKREGQRLRTCWPYLMDLEKESVRTALLQFFESSLKRGIYHDDLRHLRNILWDTSTQKLSVLDFELVGVRWNGSRDHDAVRLLAEQETACILDHVQQIEGVN